ncbi:glycerol dehydratase reactivase beta/small subunit family protein [Conexibacter sp. JD483]|uniref:glycerol dehydratase reactivase beta/small subunit family protein n=1 Tax=unclassified Conexibacter TaxID=2627773 RepID=UPI002727E8EE|nr:MULTISPECIES: glycerol dehydratase reactivase beta/small subunit family protein [unclassified Conexibacter]MDO8184917.1 glycerol dehydratase reactivase beta/small subunit family protein [Conexibacter sp. CPCC 205706]MDO8198061.1 glycerol dehydratase reactivase beta/small subunit family protein [Conexibacter sp. CPCC 205762]MDR9371350.1 glycerol dehydratase reactivase beta/small subunit family protein [Conexibacter sp. JD483]
MNGPAVFLHVAASEADAGPALRELRAGLEEEGVPCRLRVVEGDAATIAWIAARASPVSVGIGLDAESVCLHLPQLAPESPLLRLPVDHLPERLRALGHNAARLVKGAPLKELP